MDRVWHEFFFFKFNFFIFINIFRDEYAPRCTTPSKSGTWLSIRWLIFSPRNASPVLLFFKIHYSMCHYQCCESRIRDPVPFWSLDRGSGMGKKSRSGSGMNIPAVLRIHDILGWIRIRIRGPMHLTNGSGSGFGSGSCYFRQWPSRCQQKTNFLTQVFLPITFWSYIYIIFQR